MSRSVTLRQSALSQLRILTGWQSWCERRTKGALVVLYHGVVEQIRDPLLDLYTVTRADLSEQVRFFQRRGEIVPISQIVDALIHNRPISSRWVALTFDDALASQLGLGQELLGQLKAPWSVSVPAGLIESGRTIWSYEFRHLLLNCWKDDQVALPGNCGKNLSTKSPAERAAAALAIGAILLQTAHAERMAYLDHLIDSTGRAEFQASLLADGRFTLASWDQIRSAHQAGVEIMSHGFHHIRHQNCREYAGVPEELRREVFDSREKIRQQIGAAPQIFVLPNGGKHPESESLIREAGYTACLTTAPSRVLSGSSLLSIPRHSGERSLLMLRRNVIN